MPPDPEDMPDFEAIDENAPADAEPVDEPEPSPKNDEAEE